MSNILNETVERIQLESMKKAHEAFGKELEAGMNAMVQAVRRHSNTFTVPAPETPEGEAKP